ncbi:hypothetical protein SKAU_G00175310 [Synaphobranchus kaupii]|uniref:Uncharacterized protein n=1 Tax=Synaphobranchus kaupii TaxID=118154 RepID=A0A9Q1J077_SYNKA|nr:hypothetical protein SKAU_G00175310 [Synaphobranchus kaupii]
MTVESAGPRISEYSCSQTSSSINLCPFSRSCPPNSLAVMTSYDLHLHVTWLLGSRFSRCHAGYSDPTRPVRTTSSWKT